MSCMGCDFEAVPSSFEIVYAIPWCFTLKVLRSCTATAGLCAPCCCGTPLGAELSYAATATNREHIVRAEQAAEEDLSQHSISNSGGGNSSSNGMMSPTQLTAQGSHVAKLRKLQGRS
jgi:hypothetical protein